MIPKYCAKCGDEMVNVLEECYILSDDGRFNMFTGKSEKRKWYLSYMVCPKKRWWNSHTKHELGLTNRSVL